MPSPYPVVSLLGSLMFLMRHEPGATSHHAALLDALRAVRAGADLTVEADREGLRVNDLAAPLDAPGIAFISEQMLLHGIRIMTIPTVLPDDDFLRVLSVLAAFPGTYPAFKDVLEALGPTASRIALTRTTSEFEVFRAMPSRTSPVLQTDGTADPRLVNMPEIRRNEADDFERPQDISLDPRVTEAEAASELSGGTPARSRPGLKQLVASGRRAIAAADWNGLLDACLEVSVGESESPSELAGSTYRIELRRLLPRKHLQVIARLTHGDRRQDAVTILRRFGPEATDLLMELLVDGATLGERRSYFSAITQIKQGNDAILQHLTHPQWFVVRNAANLCGEMNLAEAVPELILQCQHPDERVRKAVADALGRIGTPGSIEGLRKMLTDSAAGVRMESLSHLSGRRAKGITGAIGELLEREGDEAVRQEAFLALGRIGAPESLSLLAEWAAPGGMLLARRPLALRLAAIRGLVLAGPAAVEKLASLQRDAAPEIRAAASRALEALTP